MSALLTLRDLSFSTPDGRDLFPPLTLGFGRERTGLVGRNGIGKSTLLRLMAGSLAPTSGHLSQAGRVAMLRQLVQVDPDETVAEAFGASDQLARMTRIVAGEASDDDGSDLDWTLESRITEALGRLGLGGLDLDRPLASLSGGQRTRVFLAALVFDPPDLILLDEPTNHLDRDGRAAVIELLASWRGGAVVVSHDRGLLRTMDRIVELSGLGAAVFGGNYDHYALRKAGERAAAEHDLAVAERSIREVAQKAQVAAERKARRDGAGKRSRDKAGASKLLLDAREDRAEKTSGRGQRLAERQRKDAAEALAAARAKVEIVGTLAFAVEGARVPQGRTLLAFDRVSGGPAPGITVIRDLSMSIVGPERVALVGPNGAGKSTLLRLAAGELAPSSGRLERPGRAVMLDQSMGLLDPKASILDNFRHINPAANQNACRAALARFLFRADAALRPVGALSGGELLRAGLACVLGGDSRPELLILDEPTNHLDLTSVEAVEQALGGFDGALLVVSHDEDFLAAIGIERRIALS